MLGGVSRRRPGRVLRALVGLASLLSAVGWGAPARIRSQDAPPFLMAEPTEFTDVLDAFDSETDPLDFRVHLAFARTRRDSLIERERPGQYELTTLDVARFRSIRSELIVGIDVGLYRDLMVYGRLPLVFSDTRQLSWPEAADCGSNLCLLRQMQVERVLRDAAPGTDSTADSSLLFNLEDGLDAPTRSGVPAIDLGVAWGITNQYRVRQLPTWVVLFDTRIAVGQPMQACIEEGCDPGISRGTLRARLESRWSYRYRFVEPFLGLDYALEWATTADRAFAPAGDDPSQVGTDLPRVAGMTLGAAFVPWEDRGRFQQLAIDVRGRAEHISAGRDYSPLYDALGQSANSYLRAQGPGAAPFNGLLHVDAHARFELDLSLVLSAARYVRFRLGFVLSHVNSHLLTSAEPCSERVRTSGSPEGGCGDRQPNVLYRGVIDHAGQRFRLSSDLAYGLSASATGNF